MKPAWPPRLCLYPGCFNRFIPTQGRQRVCVSHPCMVDGCLSKRQSIRYCNSHEKSFRKYGDPLKARGTVFCRTLCDYECGRVAAFVDGEGHISAWVDNSDVVHVKVGIANSNYILMNYLSDILGCGSVSSKQEDPRWKRGYEFQIRRMNDVSYLLKQIKDHLLLKREQACLVLEIIVLRQSFYGSRVTDEEYRIVDRVRMLNKRGC